MAALEKCMVGDPACLKSLTDALDTIHLRCLPKTGLGFAGLYRQIGEAGKPARFAYDQGCRLYVGGRVEQRPNPLELAPLSHLRSSDLSQCTATQGSTTRDRFHPKCSRCSK